MEPSRINKNDYTYEYDSPDITTASYCSSSRSKQKLVRRWLGQQQMPSVHTPNRSSVPFSSSYGPVPPYYTVGVSIICEIIRVFDSGEGTITFFFRLFYMDSNVYVGHTISCWFLRSILRVTIRWADVHNPLWKVDAGFLYPFKSPGSIRNVSEGGEKMCHPRGVIRGGKRLLSVRSSRLDCV